MAADDVSAARAVVLAYESGFVRLGQLGDSDIG
jgi:hypothetical protein